MNEMQGKVALITGAARGQGRNHAVELARQGVSIIAVDSCAPIDTVPYPLSSSDDLAATVGEIERCGGKVLAEVCDVRSLADLESVSARGYDTFGRIDFVCANAGISSPCPTLEMSEQVWQDMVDVNLTGVWKTCRAAVPYIVQGGRGGAVVITSSAATSIISANIAHYTASKLGLVGLMKVLAKELAPHRIRVNTIHPTGVGTPMILNESMYRLFRPDLAAPTREDFDAQASTHNLLGIPYLGVDDVSAAVLYLLSDAGRYITGSSLLLDAGGSI